MDLQDSKKDFSNFWSSKVRIYRRARSRIGYFVQWHQQEAELYRANTLCDNWVATLRWWADWEVPQGFWAELGPPLDYIGSRILRDRTREWRVVVITQWVIEAVAYLVWGAYATSRLWNLSDKIVDAFDTLDLSVPLENDGVHDAKRFGAVIRSTRWARVPLYQAVRTGDSVNLSPGGAGGCGDFIWFDPIRDVEVFSSTAKVGRYAAYSAGTTPFPQARERASSGA